MSENNTATDLEQIWHSMFMRSLYTTVDGHGDANMVRMDLLLKTLYYNVKEIVKKNKEKDETIARLEEELSILKARSENSIDASTSDGALTMFTAADTTPPCEVEELEELPCAASRAPRKRLSNEGPDSSLGDDSKKIKTSTPPTTPQKSPQISTAIKHELLDIYVPETLAADYDIRPVENPQLIPESFNVSEDLFLDNTGVLQENSPSKGDETVVKTPKSPVFHCKSRGRRSLENRRRFTPTPPAVPHPSPDPPPVETKKPSKPTRIPIFVSPSPKKITTVTKYRSPNSSPMKVDDDFKVSKATTSNATKWQQVRKNLINFNYKEGVSKTEVLPPEKVVKPTRLRQTRLSLSMFQSKKKKEQKKQSVQEDENLKLAMEESLKLSTPLMRAPEKELYSPSPDCYSVRPIQRSMDLDQTYFSGAESMLRCRESPEVSGIFRPPDPKIEVTEENVEEEGGAAGPSRYPAPGSLEYLKDFDRLPEKQKDDPGYVYRGGVVRKKEEREQLPGWVCHECKRTYEALQMDMSSQEFRNMVSSCSKHRQAQPVIGNTPPGIWEIGVIHTPHGTTQAGTLAKHRQAVGSRRIDRAVKLPTQEAKPPDF